MLTGERPDFGQQVVEVAHVLRGKLLLSDRGEFGLALFGFLHLVGIDDAFIHRDAGLARDENGGDIIGHGDDVALLVLAPEPVMNARNNDPEHLHSAS